MIILLIVTVFLPVGFTGYLFLTAVILSLFAISLLSWRMLMNLLIPVGFIFIIIFLVNIFLMHPNSEFVHTLLNGNNSFTGTDIIFNRSGDTINGFIGPDFKDSLTGITDPAQITAVKNLIPLGHFFNWKVMWFSEKALYSAFLMGWRIYLMITLTTILTGSTQPLELTLAIEDILYPLKLIGIPVYILSMIISIALRMIPTLIDEAGRIMKAQASRGIDIKNGKFKDKAKGLTALIIPLLVSSFQKAEDLAYAMDARGYDPHSKRTRYVQFEFRWTDLIFFLTGVTLFVLLIVYSQLAPTSGALLHLPYIDRIITY
jgi:energy-coupling factor transport system permease protein